jgi:uncharacterized membrane protein (DUF485 family)
MHGPAAKLGKDNASPAKSKLGLILFGVYSLIYAGFVVITVASPASMGMPVFGMNLASAYGFGLILLAIVMGLAYNHICTGLEKKLNKPEASSDAR